MHSYLWHDLRQGNGRTGRKMIIYYISATGNNRTTGHTNVVKWWKEVKKKLNNLHLIRKVHKENEETGNDTLRA